MEQNQITPAQKKSISELAQDLTGITKHVDFNNFLDNNPPAKWVQLHPFNKHKVNGKNVPVPYLPIGVVESLLNAIFPINKIEVLSFGQLAQSVTCHVRVHYLHPVSGDWLYHDGLGAVDIQTAKGTSAADLGAINSGAIQKGLPAAKAYAVKNACQNFGRLFGRDVAREFNVQIEPRYKDDYNDKLQMLKKQ